MTTSTETRREETQAGDLLHSDVKREIEKLIHEMVHQVAKEKGVSVQEFDHLMRDAKDAPGGYLRREEDMPFRRLEQTTKLYRETFGE